MVILIYIPHWFVSNQSIYAQLEEKDQVHIPPMVEMAAISLSWVERQKVKVYMTTEEASPFEAEHPLRDTVAQSSSSQVIQLSLHPGIFVS